MQGKEKWKMGVLSDLEPKGVWRFFEELSGIPRGSHNEKAASDYCMRFARERGLEAYQDEKWNVIIIKEASRGYEKAQPLILQGHLDMVCEKEPDCGIDFERDGLKLAVDGDYVYAKGTTLGGDDGIAVAYALAVLEDDGIPHPRLEVVLTTCEEVGMDGAKALDVSVLRGHTVLNLDSEEEGILLSGCAGGCTAAVRLPIQRIAGRGIRAVLTVDGLAGGHSGAEIDKGRGNADLLLFGVLGSLSKEIPFHLISVLGGKKDNAIPRESRAELLLPAEAVERLKEICESCGRNYQRIYASTDSGISVSVEILGEGDALCFDGSSQRKAIALILALPNGIQAMSGDIQGLVETSLNLGILKTVEDSLCLSYSVRSSVAPAKELLLQKLQIVAEAFGAEVSLSGDYPAWEFCKKSSFREKLVEIYQELFGQVPKVEVMHAGLECGILASKLPNLDCVSIGPDIFDIHTTEEHMSISSVERMWRFLLEILRRS